VANGAIYDGRGRNRGLVLSRDARVMLGELIYAKEGRRAGIKMREPFG
jgi:hypothetical protein